MTLPLNAQPRELMKHQVSAMRFIAKRPKPFQAMLAMRPGTGKTLTAIRAMKLKLPVLVICRRDDFLTWETELMLEGFRPLDMDFITSASKIDSMHEDAPAPWTHVTYDLMKNPQVQKHLSKIAFRGVIADEVHSIQHVKSQRHKDVVRNTQNIPFRLGLTGSFISNELDNVFGQLAFVDLGKTFGKSIWNFWKKFYIKAAIGQGQKWYPKKKSKDQIAKKMSNVVFHVHEDDVLELPPVRTVIKSARMSGQQRRYQEQVLNDFEMTISGQPEILEMDYVVQQLSKLRQIASGFFYYEDQETGQRMVRKLRCPKRDLLIELLTESDFAEKEKVVVWCAHSAEIDLISMALQDVGVRHVKYSGRMNLANRVKTRKRFQGNKRIRVFIGQVDMGVGMNELVVADTAIWFSNSYRVVSRDQSAARTRRKGSEIHREIFNCDLMTEGSVDPKIYQSLQSNISTATYVLNQLKDGRSLEKIFETRI